METSKNLSDAFAGESQANRRYLAFARKAQEEGFPQIARLFRAAAEAETVHALNHFRVMGGVKGTVDNLQAAIEGEGYEFQKMYPEFVKQADAEGQKAAGNSFRLALAVEKIHHGLFTAALQAQQSAKDLPAEPIWVCNVCGNTVAGSPPDKCPICGNPRSGFMEIR